MEIHQSYVSLYIFAIMVLVATTFIYSSLLVCLCILTYSKVITKFFQKVLQCYIRKRRKLNKKKQKIKEKNKIIKSTLVISNIPVFQSDNKIYFNTIDIKTIHLLVKLLYQYLRLYIVEKWVKLIAYYLKLRHVLRRLNFMFLSGTVHTGNESL